MGKKVFKLFSLVLIALMVLGVFVGCGGNTEKSKTVSADGERNFDEINYTYREVWSAGPLNWNPHSWEMSGDSAFMDYLTTPLAYSRKAAKDGEWEWAYSAATGVKDITKDFADKAKYDIPADAVKERVFQIDLNPSMKWENGEKITADDYIYSMQMLLNPEMKNYRANTYMVGETAIYNAKGYYKNDLAGKPIYADFSADDVPADAVPLLTLTNNVRFFGDSAEAYYNKEKYKGKFIANDVDLFEKYKGKEFFEATEEAKKDMLVIAKAFGDNNDGAWKEFAVYDTGEKYAETPWESVGLLKTGEYQLVYITPQPVQMFYMMNNLGGNWLVHKDTYEANMKTVAKLKASQYGTSKDNTMSYGPYKIQAYEKAKQIRLVRNPNWGGYHDDLHKGQYQADAVVIDIIPSHTTMLQRFGQGLVDEAPLEADDVEKYRKSDRLYYTDLTYTARYIFATSTESLKARDAEKGSGKRIVLHYKDFRKALSLCIDRDKYCKEATAGFKPAYFLFNSLYYYDMANDPNSIYRNSKYAKKAILDLYKMDYNDGNMEEKYERITGRDLGLAKDLFKSAYKQAVADGNYKDGEDVPIEVMVHPKELKPQQIKQQDLLQEFFDEGSKGTPFEGKIKVKFEAGDEKRYDNVNAGKNMAIHGAWGGAAFYPFSTIRVYTNPTYMGGLNKIHEGNGWDPGKAKLTLTIERTDGETVTEERTFEEWSNAINGDGDYASRPGVEQLQILAGLERGVLETYQCIPVGTYTSATLLSYKIDYQTEAYNIMYGYGSFRYLKFNYTDEEWKAYIQKNGGELNYE